MLYTTAAIVVTVGHCRLHAAAPSSLIQLRGSSSVDTGDSILQVVKNQVSEFQKKMSEEAKHDKEEIRQLHEEQRKMEREEEAFKSKVFASSNRLGGIGGASSFSQVKTGIHFGDPYIDETMRVLTEDLQSQKMELQRLVGGSRIQPSLIETQRPDLGVIGAALKARISMATRDGK